MTARQPSFDDVVALPAWVEGVVGPEHLDENDHVNILHYLAWSDLAAGRWCEPLGLGIESYARLGFTQFVAEYHLTYLGELRLGDRYSAHVRILDRGDRAMHTMTFLLDHERRRLSFTAEMMALNIDAQSRRTADFLPDIAKAIDAEIATDVAIEWSVARSGAMAVRR